MEQSITDTIVNNQITNKYILNSYNYFKNLKSINPTITQIITDYRNEVLKSTINLLLLTRYI